jgi:hypothetical protein
MQLRYARDPGSSMDAGVERPSLSCRIGSLAPGQKTEPDARRGTFQVAGAPGRPVRAPAWKSGGYLGRAPGGGPSTGSIARPLPQIVTELSFVHCGLQRLRRRTRRQPKVRRAWPVTCNLSPATCHLVSACASSISVNSFARSTTSTNGDPLVLFVTTQIVGVCWMPTLWPRSKSAFTSA